MQFLVRDHLPDPANVACNYKGIGSITPSTPTWALKGEDIAKFLKPLLLAATEKWKHMKSEWSVSQGSYGFTEEVMHGLHSEGPFYYHERCLAYSLMKSSLSLSFFLAWISNTGYVFY